ncbi:MAG: hypothetical protein ACYCZF_13830 [Anaerolineae bacterium]
MNALTPITTAAVVGLSTEGVYLIQKKKMTVRPIIGAFVLGIFLLGISSANAELGKYFSVLILLTTALVNGPALLSVVKG